MDEMDGIYYDQDDYYDENDESFGFSSEDENEIPDDIEDNYRRRRRRRMAPHRGHEMGMYMQRPKRGDP